MFTPDDLREAVHGTDDLQVGSGGSEPQTTVVVRSRDPNKDASVEVRFLAHGRIRLDETWDVSFADITRGDAIARVLSHARLTIASHGKDVAATTRGGPRKDQRITIPWAEARCWHLFSVTRPRFDIYKWHLECADDLALVLEFEKTVSLDGLADFASKHRPAVQREEPARVEGDPVMKVFGREPYASLGWDFLQEQCDRWLRTPRAREFGVSYVGVGGPPGALGITEISIVSPPCDEGERLTFPFDDLAFSILDSAAIPAHVREEEKAHLRQFWAEHSEVFRHFRANPGATK